ncbi:unknown [Dialister sp. CAG:486]|nr:unknown [Dialister sp. CAG:486]
MNVCDQRYIHFRTERAQSFCRFFIRHGDPDDICSRLMQGLDLRCSGVRIERAERAHRLDRNGRAPTDLDTADNDLSGISHLNLLFVVVYMNIWFRVRFAFLKTSYPYHRRLE